MCSFFSACSLGCLSDASPPFPPLFFFFFFFSLFLCLILAFSTLQLQFPVRSTFRVHEREHGQVRGPLVLVILVMIRLMFQKLALGSDHIGILDRVLQTSRICKFAYMSMPIDRKSVV